MYEPKMRPLYAVKGSNGEAPKYFCRVCAWTFERDHVHFDFTVQRTLGEFI